MSECDEVCVCPWEMTYVFIDEVEEFTAKTYLSFLTLPSIEKSRADNFRLIEFPHYIYFFRVPNARLILKENRFIFVKLAVYPYSLLGSCPNCQLIGGEYNSILITYKSGSQQTYKRWSQVH